MTILTGQLLLCDQPSEARIVPGYIRIDGNRTVEVVEGEIAPHADYGNANSLISPGFIDAHVHLPQFDTIGGHGLPLLGWLNDVTFPAERKWQDNDYARSMTTRAVQQCLSVGTTAMCGYATVHHGGAIAALEVASEIGMRGVIGQVLMDRQAPEYLCGEARQLIDEVAITLDRFPPGARMSAAVTPRFAVSCTAELLAAAGELAQQSGAVIQTHLAETMRECALVSELFAGASYVEVYEQTGLMTDKTIFGHGIHLSESDRKMLCESKSVIAHCPTANSFLRSGTMDRNELIRSGVRLATGSDIGAGYERSMVRVARAMIESAAAIGAEYPTPSEAWYQITAGTANSLGWDDVGLEVGNPADILVIEPDIPWLQSSVAPLSMLMFAWDDRWITKTILQGR